MKPLLLFSAAILFLNSAFSQVMNDVNKRNQIESMVYKQWKFSPDWYYYSWYTQKILGIKVRMPGQGIHDKGPGGIGIIGDNYVNGDKRNIHKYTPTIMATKVIQDNMKETSKSDDAIAQREMLEHIDNTFDVVYKTKAGTLSDLDNQCHTEISIMASNKVEIENIAKFNAELERIQNLIQATIQSSIPNAERLESYIEAEEAYINLLKKARSLNKLYKKFK